jgi:acetyl-CoA carboxylase alpha subunit
LSLPIIIFVERPDAYFGIGSQKRHVVEAIAVNLCDMGHFKASIFSIVIAEGGPGGALRVTVADLAPALENAYHSVIFPEGCLVILWKG